MADLGGGGGVRGAPAPYNLQNTFFSILTDSFGAHMGGCALLLSKIPGHAPPSEITMNSRDTEVNSLLRDDLGLPRKRSDLVFFLCPQPASINLVLNLNQPGTIEEHFPSEKLSFSVRFGRINRGNYQI